MSYYDILNVTISDDLSIIQQSYIKLLKKAKQLNLDVSILNKAYNTLKNPHNRAKYDQELQEKQNLNNTIKQPDLYESQFVKLSDSKLDNLYLEHTSLDKHDKLDSKLQNLIFEREQDDIETKYTEELYNGLSFNTNEYDNAENISRSNNQDTTNNETYKQAILDKNWDELKKIRDEEIPKIPYNKDTLKIISIPRKLHDTSKIGKSVID
jgi:DnaJ-class molecular chaperone